MELGLSKVNLNPFHILLLLLLLLLLCIVCTNKNRWCSGERSVEFALGPGFKSQVPQLLHIIFLFRISCMYNPRVHHTPFQSSQPSVRWPNLMAIIWRCIMSQVKRITLDLKGQRGPHSNGPRSGYLHPSKQYSGPFSLFYFLFYFISFNLFIYLLTKN